MRQKIICVLVLIFLLVPLVEASPNLDIEKEKIRKTIIPELGGPAIYELKIENLGESDNFEIYSLVGVEIKSGGPHQIVNGEQKIVRAELWPNDAILRERDSLNFVYKIKGEKTGIKEDSLSIIIHSLEEAIEIKPVNIKIGDEEATIYVRNRGDYEMGSVKADFNSDFFDFSKNFSLDKYEEKEFVIPLEGEIEKKSAGEYELKTELNVDGIEETIVSSFNYEESPNIISSEKGDGLLIESHEIIKKNEGNLPVVVQVKMKKSIISRLFSYFNHEPSSVEREGITVTYTFKKEVDPGEEYRVKSTTNWIYPLLLLIALVIIVWLINLYSKRDLVLNKKATYVKTKSGKFALKVRVIARAKKFVENINVVDKIPSLVKVHKQFGASEPDKIDEKNRRLEWNIDSLQEGEERIFTYIIYSDVAPVGKFELPTATSVYERDGKIMESESNRVFFVTDKRKKASTTED
mgnify:CR=1 FL=1